MYFVFLLQNAINITSKLLKDASEIQSSDLNTNILVSCDKLEKFAIQYATHHITSHNDSEAEISIEQQELGEAFWNWFVCTWRITITLLIKGSQKNLWCLYLINLNNSRALQDPPPRLRPCYTALDFPFSIFFSRQLFILRRPPFLLFCVDWNYSSFYVRLEAVTVRRIPSNHKSDVVFPSAASSFNESFIQDDMEAITLPASLFTDEGNVE